MSIKTEIDTLCKDLLMSNTGEYISVPTVLMVYLGEETYSVVNASLKDAFTTSFKVEPNVYDILVRDANVTGLELRGQMVKAIRTIQEQGKNYDDLRITFVSLMDDKILQVDSIKLVETIRETLATLVNYGLSVNKTAFYGIFRQEAMEQNYNHALKFVNAGKDIWKNIYHMEITVFDLNIHKYMKLLAINTINDDYKMKQVDGSEEYMWKSLFLYYLKVPELIIAKVLRKIYANQINGSGLNLDEWKDNVYSELGTTLQNLFTKQESDCEQYIPLCYYEEKMEQPVKRGFLGGIFGKKESVEDNSSSYDKIIMDENSISQLLKETYESIHLDEEDCHKIMERIISAASAIDTNHQNVSYSICSFLNTKIKELKAALETSVNELKFKNIDTNNATSYVRNVYLQKRDILIMRKKIEALEQLKKYISNDNFLNQLIKDICKKNQKYANTLDELSQNEYGGTLEQERIQIGELPSFKVNQSVQEILKNIGVNKLSGILNDPEIIFANLEQFLSQIIHVKGIHLGHNLGEVNGTYYTLEPVKAVLLLTPAMENEQRVQAMLHKISGIGVASKSLYRENTFYVITSRMYSSDRYIVRYKRV